MQLSNLIEGLQILKTYYESQDGYKTGADHDIIYAYATDRRLPETAVNRMIELEWFQPDAERNEDGEFTAEFYNPEEGWAAYT